MYITDSEPGEDSLAHSGRRRIQPRFRYVFLCVLLFMHGTTGIDRGRGEDENVLVGM